LRPPATFLAAAGAAAGSSGTTGVCAVAGASRERVRIGIRTAVRMGVRVVSSNVVETGSQYRKLVN
jgi:hypothetical protein